MSNANYWMKLQSTGGGAHPVAGNAYPPYPPPPQRHVAPAMPWQLAAAAAASSNNAGLPPFGSPVGRLYNFPGAGRMYNIPATTNLRQQQQHNSSSGNSAATTPVSFGPNFAAQVRANARANNRAASSGHNAAPYTKRNTNSNANSPPTENRSIKRQLDEEVPYDQKRQRLGVDQERVGGGVGGTFPSRPVEISDDKLSSAIINYFNRHHQADEVYRKKMKLRDALYGILQGVFPYCGLYAVGSSMSGFGTNQSDMDLCLMLTREQIDQKCEATEILKLVHKGFKKCSFITTSQVIKAKVPILKFWDDISNVECDLNINNSVGIRNTHLLKAYASVDWRVRPLVLFIKYWSRFHDINDARKQTISSYSFGLMVIHYLQYGCSPPVLPVLQKLYPDVFSLKNDFSNLRLDEDLPVFESKNTQNLGELYLGFLKYYATEFDFSSHVISVRTGTRLRVSEAKSKVDTPNQWKFLCIEEPFDLSNTARAVFDFDTFNRIRRVFTNSYYRLSRRRELTDILSRQF
ncbi:poly(A) RNA polymerase GLD2-like [Argonauta hians]